MSTATLTIDLQAEEVEFLKAYARKQGLTAAEVVADYIRGLRSGAQLAIHPEVAAISGLAPAETDAAAEFKTRLLKKHQ